MKVFLPVGLSTRFSLLLRTPAAGRVLSLPARDAFAKLPSLRVRPGPRDIFLLCGHASFVAPGLLFFPAKGLF